MAKNIKKNNKKINKAKKNTQKNLEMKVFLFFAAVLILTLANFGVFGIVGKYLRGCFFFLIGSIFYLIPLSALLLFLYAKTMNSERKKLLKKYIFLILLLIVITSCIELIFNYGYDLSKSINRNFFENIGGGIIGFIISSSLVKLFSIYGTVVIFIFIVSFCILYILDFLPITYIMNIIKNTDNKKELKNKISDEKVAIRNDIESKNIVIKDTDNSNDRNLDELFQRILPIDNEFSTEEKEEVKLNKIKDEKNDEKVTIQPITNVENDKEYNLPSIELLTKSVKNSTSDSSNVKNMALTLKQTLDSFGVNAEISNISIGPTVTRFEIVPDIGVKVSKIVGLSDDIKLSLAAKEIRMEAPIPGKSAIGIEVPNKDNVMVRLRDLLESNEFNNASSKLSFCVGLNIEGKPIISDIQKMPHVLIAGATGAGKSVCINTLIMSILFKARPDEVKLLMIDPKVVELSIYNGIPHLLIPVVTDPKRASSALNWAIAEMDKRYKLFAKRGVKDIFGYNNKLEPDEEKIPQIVIIIDELADLMMVASNEVEHAICRIAQLARACGIHLVIATQRPSVNVITGLIKANIPSRIAFAVSSGVDSRTILDTNGAEKLLGKGDMLFHPAGLPKPIRVQGAFVDEKEISQVVKSIAVEDKEVVYNKEVSTALDKGYSENSGLSEYDDYFEEAARLVIEKERASIGLLQRVLKIGFNRAARIMDQLFEAGVVGAEEGTKPRKILLTEEQLEELIENLK